MLQSNKTTVSVMNDPINQAIVSVYRTYLSQLLPFPGIPEPSLSCGLPGKKGRGRSPQVGLGMAVSVVFKIKKESR